MRAEKEKEKEKEGKEGAVSMARKKIEEIRKQKVAEVLQRELGKLYPCTMLYERF